MNNQIQLFNIPDYKVQPRDYKGQYFYKEKEEEYIRQIRNHFEAGGTLTVLECQKKYRTTELRKFVCELKKKGLNIVGDWFYIGTKRAYKIYRLRK